MHIRFKKSQKPRHTTYYSEDFSLPLCKQSLDGDNQSASKRLESLYEWVGAAVFSLIFVILAFIFLFRIVGVDGHSMEPTLLNKERLVISTCMYQPKRGDIVIVDRYTQEPLVKRIIGVGGDKISILPESGQVVLNGVILEEEYIKGQTVLNDFGTETKTVPEGYLLVMGDNREISKDSRSSEIGFVSENDVVGKVILRFLPISRFRLF